MEKDKNDSNSGVVQSNVERARVRKGTMKHTPTPWFTMPLNHYIFSGKEPQELAVCRFDMKLPPEQNKANADFIVRAVNAHEELVQAAKDYLADLSDKTGTWTKERLEQAIAKAEK